MSSVKTLSVQCPTCSKPVLMTNEFPHRPFCSERCKAIDFGDWASESHRIPGQNILEGDSEQDSWSEDLKK